MAYENADVDSTCFSRLAYDEESETVIMTFRKGGYYSIEGFPAIEWARWKSSGSLGAYFNANVRGEY